MLKKQLKCCIRTFSHQLPESTSLKKLRKQINISRKGFKYWVKKLVNALMLLRRI